MIPVFGTAAVLVAPPAPLLATGYVPGNTLTAQHFNYEMYHLTKELNNVLTAAGVAQSGSVDTQILSSILGITGSAIYSGTYTGTVLSAPGTYIFTGASTVTLPASPSIGGVRFTFKSKGNYHSVISANSGQTIGTTSSTSFILGANTSPQNGQEDYVTLEWDGTSIWYVVATNGPIQYSPQTGTTYTNSAGVWTAIGNGLALANIPPGVYDFELSANVSMVGANSTGIVIAQGTSPISESSGVSNSGATVKVTLKGYVLTSLSTIQGMYYSTTTTGQIAPVSPNLVGMITARRIS